MKDEIHSTSINPDVVEQFLALMNTHCKSSEEALTMLSTLCYNCSGQVILATVLQ